MKLAAFILRGFYNCISDLLRKIVKQAAMEKNPPLYLHKVASTAENDIEYLTLERTSFGCKSNIYKVVVFGL